jgi:hypothetical protein
MASRRGRKGGKIRAFVMILSVHGITRLTPAGLKQQATEEREREWVGENSRILCDITTLKGKLGRLYRFFSRIYFPLSIIFGYIPY